MVNEAANIHYMTGGQTEVPVTFYSLAGCAAPAPRSIPIAPRRCSARLPGLQILAPGGRRRRLHLLKWALLESRNPTVFLSHRLLFDETAEIDPDAPMLPVGQARIRREGRDVTIIASSITVPRALAAADTLARTHTASPPRSWICAASCRSTATPSAVGRQDRTRGDRRRMPPQLRRRGRDRRRPGGGRACAACKAPVRRVAVPDVPIPYSPPLEAELTVTADKIAAAALAALGRS